MIKEFRMNTKHFAKLSIIVIFAIIIIFGLISVFDTDATISKEENRTLKSKPKFSISSIMKGNYTKEFDEYYSDTFPMRSSYIKTNKSINKFLAQFSGNDDLIIVNRDTNENDFQGESLEDAEK